MAFTDLQAFLRYLEAVGELRRVRVEVDPALEIPAIAARVVKEGGPALLFEKVRGSSFPVAINIFGSARRIELALGRHPAEIGSQLAGLIEGLSAPSWRGLWSARGALRQMLNARARHVRHALSQEVSEAPDLDRLPVLTCWPKDGGRFLTFPLVLTHDPATGRRNLGVYRMQVHSQNTTGMHWQLQKGGGFHYHLAEKSNQPLQLAVVLGGDPALLIAAVAPLPEGLDEVAFAGLLRGAPTPMVRARTIACHVPAHAEFILEGSVPPQERSLEGPFGDHYGHYSAAAPFPVFHVERITRRRTAVYPASVVGKPPQEDRFLGEAVQELLGPVMRVLRPGLRDLWAYYEAGFHNLLVAAVDARYHKEAVRVALGLLGEGQLALAKCLILVDGEVNPRDFRAVLRQIREHFDPAADFILIPGAPVDTLDFTSFEMHLGGKMILDATRRHRNDGAEAAGPGSDCLAAAQRWDPRALSPSVADWELLEGTLLAVKLDAGASGREVLRELLDGCPRLGPRIIAAVSDDVDVRDPVALLWGIFTRFDPARDVLFREVELHGSWTRCHGPVAIDATWKDGYPEPVAMAEEVEDRVARRWAQYGIGRGF